MTAHLQVLVIDTHRSSVSASDDKAELREFELGAQKQTLIYVYKSAKSSPTLTACWFSCILSSEAQEGITQQGAPV